MDKDQQETNFGDSEAPPGSSEGQESVEMNPVATTEPPSETDGSITWTASEFIAHQKSAKWYLTLTVVTVALAGLVYLLTKDLITTIAIIIAAMLLAVEATKKPRELEYSLDGQGLHVGTKIHSFDQFRSFAIVHQGAFSSIMLFPLKRFSLMTQAFYDPADEQKITSLLTARLPLDDKKRDWFDELMWRIKY